MVSGASTSWQPRWRMTWNLSNKIVDCGAYVFDREAFRIEGIVGPNVEPPALHCAVAPTEHSPDLKLQVDARIARRQIADPPHSSVVPDGMLPAANAAHRFFERRTSAAMRPFGSPYTPRARCYGRNPGKAYRQVAALARVFWSSHQRAKFSQARTTPRTQHPSGPQRDHGPKSTHPMSRRPAIIFNIPGNQGRSHEVGKRFRSDPVDVGLRSSAASHPSGPCTCLPDPRTRFHRPRRIPGTASAPRPRWRRSWPAAASCWRTPR